MHSFGDRFNGMVVFALNVLAVLCGLASLSDSFNHPTPSAQLKVLNINWLRNLPTGHDEVSLTLDISADLQSLFTWNTKQVFVFVAAEYVTPQNALNQISLWDDVIQIKERARFQIQTINKYNFVDQGSHLRGKQFNLTLHWHVMPKIGKMFANNLTMTGYRLPEDYI